MRALLIAVALGVLALQLEPELPRPAARAWVALPIAAGVIAFLLARLLKGRLRAVAHAAAFAAACAAVGLAGFHYATWRAEMRLADALPTAWEGRDVEVIGVVDDLPQSSGRGPRFAFAVEHVATPGAVIPSRVSLVWYAAWRDDEEATDGPDIHAGERWSLTVRLKRPHGTVNPHGFDVEAWLLENELRATGFVREGDHNRRLDAFAGRLGDYVQCARETIRDRIFAALDGRPYAGVIAALAIGDERAIPEEQWRVF